ncbi:MAG TPA: hypothetical protein VLB46_11870 [Pyrinomonadaceae bacterium]|nr:hypothetical protein [Pyrinomonadaceae bacterium]
METSNTPITDFDTLLARIENPKDKLLCACIATFADIGLAEQFISHLVNLPEPINPDKEFFGIKAKQIMGMNKLQAMRCFNLNENEVETIQNYLGLTDNSAQAGIRN